MDKIWQKFLLIVVCLLMTTNGFANNPDTTKIPNLKLKNDKLKELIEDLIKEEAIEDNDVVLINFIEQDNELYLDIVFSHKNRLFLLNASWSCRTRKFIGYSKILNHDCYVFGDKTERFFTEKDSVQLPKYFNWLLSLNHMEEEDFLPPKHFNVDSDGNLREVVFDVDTFWLTYKYVKKHFIRSHDRVSFR